MLNKRLNKLKNENNSNIKALTESHQNEINKCIQYTQSKGVRQYDCEILRKDLISMYFEHEIRDEAIDFSDSKHICDSFVDNAGKNSLLYILYHFSIASLFYMFFDILFSSATSINVIVLIRGAATLLILSGWKLILPNYALTSDKKYIYFYHLLLFSSIFILCMILNTFGNAILFVIPFWVRLSFNIMFFIVMFRCWGQKVF